MNKKLLVLITILLFPTIIFAQFVQMKNRMFSVSGNEFVVKGIWLEPDDYNWTNWWALSTTTFEADVSSEVSMASWLGVNVISTIVDTASIQNADFMTKFDFLVEQCRSNGIRLAPMLLGWGLFLGMNISNYIDSTRAKSLIYNVVNTYKSDTTIAWWGLRHEGFNQFYLRGFPVAGIDSLTEFYKTFHSYVSSIDPNHLISSGGDDVYDFPRSFELNTNGIKMSDVTDFIPIQFYKDIGIWMGPYYGNVDSYLTTYGLVDSYLGVLRFLKSSKGNDMLGRPLYINEIGFWTDNTVAGNTVYDQVNYYDYFGHVWRKKMIAGVSIWSIKDRSLTNHSWMYGLYDYNGYKKPAAYWYKDWSLKSEAYDIWK